ncbi:MULTISPECIES: CaiB/BaiF CoA transferase family protein [Streptomyces]|uniref:CoA transferase n=1 Tax=Streptomyces thermoviolaceus subsp. thermoviolaceus TaxID=66860 RepID=A0ABX0YV94_STRTL|nr:MULTISPECIES: CoA transferase [Streptomyces]MCM3265591.1 CoA transferase [Streptomyces thermoviolaceus]NJP16525.1 CoA transferase [Streptomyces thermoviolaceus subsp. thermoviolaceus]RSS05534.1 CoA transferase [Streptomyces sp. WAC00469]WTD46504.1 CoA transferase [Streptomyces thermoviolaceus]GGV82280.1 CoA transferase [Streptomyces thermoviolaceus subsp. apingens]
MTDTPPAVPDTPGAALAGIKVLDIATLFAGPLAATLLADFGADVTKIEHPKGDPVRSHGASKDGVGLWWKMLSRNKKAVTLYLGSPEGQDIFRRMVADADVVIENFRPGTLERWGLGYDTLSEINPRLVLARVTGFGQRGPYAQRPGFGTLAEAMSGFAAITGQPDGPPTLPPFGLADGISALTAAFGIMTALHARERTGRGQVLDLAIIEPMITLLGPQAIAYDQLGELQPRTGNRSVNNAPRNIYRTKDGSWVAVSTSAQSIAERVMRLVGHPEYVDEPWFASGAERARHADELDEAVGSWIAERTRSEVVAAFEEAQAAVAPIYDMRDIFEDPQFQALETITTVEDEELGTIRFQNVPFRLSDTPGAVRWPGPRKGRDTAEVLGRYGVSADELAALAERGIV